MDTEVITVITTGATAGMVQDCAINTITEVIATAITIIEITTIDIITTVVTITGIATTILTTVIIDALPEVPTTGMIVGTIQTTMTGFTYRNLDTTIDTKQDVVYPGLCWSQIS